MEINQKNKKKTLNNINKLFNGRSDAIRFVDEYGSIILEVKIKAAEEEPKAEITKTKNKRKKSQF